MKSFRVLILFSAFFLWHPILHAGIAKNKNLIQAAKDGNLKRSKLALKKEFLQPPANIDYQDKNGCTALFWAVEKNHLDVVRYLIEAGANINLRSSSGTSPLEIILQNIVILRKKHPSSSAIILLLAHKGAEEPQDVCLKEELKKHIAAEKIQAISRGHQEKEKSRKSHTFTLINETDYTMSVRIIAERKRSEKEKTEKILALNLPVLLKPKSSWSSIFEDPNEGQTFSPCMSATVIFTPWHKGKEKSLSFRKTVTRDIPQDTVMRLNF